MLHALDLTPMILDFLRPQEHPHSKVPHAVWSSNQRLMHDGKNGVLRWQDTRVLHGLSPSFEGRPSQRRTPIASAVSTVWFKTVRQVIHKILMEAAHGV